MDERRAASVSATVMFEAKRRRGEDKAQSEERGDEREKAKMTIATVGRWC